MVYRTLHPCLQRHSTRWKHNKVRYAFTDYEFCCKPAHKIGINAETLLNEGHSVGQKLGNVVERERFGT